MQSFSASISRNGNGRVSSRQGFKNGVDGGLTSAIATDGEMNRKKRRRTMPEVSEPKEDRS